MTILLLIPFCITTLIAVSSFIYFFLSIFLIILDDKTIYTDEEEEITMFEISVSFFACLISSWISYWLLEIII